MINSTHRSREIVAKISREDKQAIKRFIQGAVYCYCKNCTGQSFAARDLFGGVNYNWGGTPLISLYDWHKYNSSSNPVEMAGKDIGWLLLDVIIEDKRIFEIIEGYTHQYKWIDGETE